MDAGPVAGLAVGVDRAAMPDRLERGNPRLDDAAPRLAIQRGHQAHAARVMLFRRVVGVRRDQMIAVVFVALDELGAGFVPSCRSWRPHSAASARPATAFAEMNLWMAAAASRPSRIAHTTSEAPRTMSPAANTPSTLVISVR